jgi:hypothetical protein
MLLPALVLLAGCTNTYSVRLTNSDVLVAKGRPRLVNGQYVFKDPQGREIRINELRVREIEVR